MNIASIIARYLLGLLFTVFGLNGFLHFIPQPPPTSPVALQFLGAVSASHYMVVVFVVQLLGGLLLLSGRYVPLALTLLAPILVNILNYHITMAPGEIGIALIATILWFLVFISVRRSFAGLLQARPDMPGTTRT